MWPSSSPKHQWLFENVTSLLIELELLIKDERLLVIREAQLYPHLWSWVIDVLTEVRSKSDKMTRFNDDARVWLGDLKSTNNDVKWTRHIRTQQSAPNATSKPTFWLEDRNMLPECHFDFWVSDDTTLGVPWRRWKQYGLHSSTWFRSVCMGEVYVSVEVYVWARYKHLTPEALFSSIYAWHDLEKRLMGHGSVDHGFKIVGIDIKLFNTGVPKICSRWNAQFALF